MWEKDVFLVRFADTLARLRFMVGYTQAEFAERLGVPFDTYISWERGGCLPSPNSFSAILRSYDAYTQRATRDLLKGAYARDKLSRRRSRRRSASGK